MLPTAQGHVDEHFLMTQLLGHLEEAAVVSIPLKHEVVLALRFHVERRTASKASGRIGLLLLMMMLHVLYGGMLGVVRRHLRWMVCHQVIVIGN